MKRISNIIALLTVFTCTARAQIPTYTDPVRVNAIIQRDKNESEKLKQLLTIQMELGTGHILAAGVYNDIAEIQTEFNEYLDKYHDMLQIAAELFGMFFEFDKLIKNINSLNAELTSKPSNAIAVAFLPQRNGVYRDTVKSSVDIAEDIYKLLFSNTKMTENERWDVVISMRKKIKVFNLQLRRTTLLIRFTSLNDVWTEITERTYRHNIKSRKDIGENCLKRWQNSGNVGKLYNLKQNK